MSSQEPSSGRSRVVILGNDAMLAARPSTPIQLARACLAYGYAFVAPVSWGDELIAEHAGEFMSSAPMGATLLLHCPYVASSIGDLPLPTLPCCVSVPPPVAAARYVRAGFAPHEVSITYVGGCPGAASPEIEEQIAPEVLLVRLGKAGCSPLLEPDHFDDIVPPDRSRYASNPGGVPAAAWLEMIASATLREVAPETLLTVARAAGPNERYLLDLASAAECRCAQDQFTVTRFEPRRSSVPVVSRELVVDLRPTSASSLVTPQREIVPPNGELTPRAQRNATAYWVFDDDAPTSSLERGTVGAPSVLDAESASAPSVSSWWPGTEAVASGGPAPPPSVPTQRAPAQVIAKAAGLERAPSRPTTPVSEASDQSRPTSSPQFIRRPVSVQRCTGPASPLAAVLRLSQRLPGRSRSVLLTNSPPVSTRPTARSTS